MPFDRMVNDVKVVESDDYIRDLTMELIMARIRGLEAEQGLMSVSGFFVYQDTITVAIRNGTTRTFQIMLEEYSFVDAKEAP